MAKERKFLKMAQFSREILRKVNREVTVKRSYRTAQSSKGIGRGTSFSRVDATLKMDRSTMETGMTVSRKDRESRRGLMGENTKALGTMENRSARA